MKTINWNLALICKVLYLFWDTLPQKIFQMMGRITISSQYSVLMGFWPNQKISKADAVYVLGVNLRRATVYWKIGARDEIVHRIRGTSL
jgi:hypothetical protein